MGCTTTSTTTTIAAAGVTPLSPTLLLSSPSFSLSSPSPPLPSSSPSSSSPVSSPVSSASPAKSTEQMQTENAPENKADVVELHSPVRSTPVSSLTDPPVSRLSPSLSLDQIVHSTVRSPSVVPTARATPLSPPRSPQTATEQTTETERDAHHHDQEEEEEEREKEDSVQRLLRALSRVSDTETERETETERDTETDTERETTVSIPTAFVLARVTEKGWIELRTSAEHYLDALSVLTQRWSLCSSTDRERQRETETETWTFIKEVTPVALDNLARLVSLCLSDSDASADWTERQLTETYSFAKSILSSSVASSCSLSSPLSAPSALSVALWSETQISQMLQSLARLSLSHQLWAETLSVSLCRLLLSLSLSDTETEEARINALGALIETLVAGLEKEMIASETETERDHTSAILCLLSTVSLCTLDATSSLLSSLSLSSSFSPFSLLSRLHFPLLALLSHSGVSHRDVSVRQQSTLSLARHYLLWQRTAKERQRQTERETEPGAEKQTEREAGAFFTPLRSMTAVQRQLLRVFIARLQTM